MAETLPKKPRKQGPKRSAASKDAILEATRAELAEKGWRSFSVDNVAKRAHASKQTIYKWWTSIGCMCVEAGLPLIPAMPGDARDPVERIASVIAPMEAACRAGNGHAVMRGVLMAAADDQDAGELWRGWMQANLRQNLRMVLAELTAKRVINRTWDIDEAVDVLFGPMLNRLLLMRNPIKIGYSRDRAAALLAIIGKP